ALKLLARGVSPLDRQWRMLRSFDNKQLPAATRITQSTASGQPASLARCAQSAQRKPASGRIK
ncbi:MAG: hypothetical protein IJ664_09050, partial [Clostridia bacterium]|nr:hypothetical protein [Clostridia bacterium]